MQLLYYRDLIDIGFSDMKEMYENMAKEMEGVKKELDRLSKYTFIQVSSLCKANHISITLWKLLSRVLGIEFTLS